MNITAIILAAAVIGITGLLIGLLLGIAGKKFAVEVDEKEIEVRALLPGNNCGGCGYAGCDAMAQAIARGEAPANGCPVASAEISGQIAKVMGADTKETVREVAFVKCNGTCDKASVKYEYYGIHDCRNLAMVPGSGDKACSHGCMGYGSCVAACPFDAIHIVNGVALVDREKCKACKKCIAACPRHLIELVPYDAQYKVACNSTEKGKDVKAACDTGCIGCKLCEKQCSSDAVHVENNLASIDYTKCVNCGACAEKCPSKIILKAKK
ncbi:MAG: RnfABCDGE type electron transport complex subunit B [Lachnospiraceae bacterium]|nr:RnfABCDGE type electron transport complex subunit B [Lachnospiraceae bacterium]